MNQPTGFCENCGAPLTPDSRFCVKCGSPVEVQAIETGAGKGIQPPPPPLHNQQSSPQVMQTTPKSNIKYLIGGIAIVLILGALFAGYYFLPQIIQKLQAVKGQSPDTASQKPETSTPLTPLKKKAPVSNTVAIPSQPQQNQNRSSQNAELLLAEGNEYMNQKRFTDAIESFSRVLALNPDYPDAYYLRGLAKEGKSDYKGALQDFERAISIAPNFDVAKKDLQKLKNKMQVKGPETILIKLDTIAAVYNNPSRKTIFTLKNPTRITKILTYHWNGGAGDSPGTIGLKDVITGQMIGLWKVTANRQGFDVTPGSVWPRRGDGPPYLYWTIQPNADLPAGSYEVVDSNPLTWAHNSETGSRGVAFVYGIARRD